MIMNVYAMPGILPDFWERRVIFVANLLSLFFGNKTETDLLRAEVGPLETYGGRLIPILSLLFRGSPNLLVLEQAPDPSLMAYFMDRLRLNLPDILVLSHPDYLNLVQNGEAGDATARALLARMREHPAAWIDGFVTDRSLTQLADTLGKNTICTRDASHRGNNKLLLHQHLEEQGLPMFTTHIVDHPRHLHTALDDLHHAGYSRAVIKSQIGASGIGILHLPTDEPPDVPNYLFHEGACLLQGWLDQEVDGVDMIGSPSVQIFIDENRATLYDLTDQILSASSVHEGNIAPPHYFSTHPAAQAEILRQASIAAEWLHAQGYRGTGSIDFHVVLRRGEVEIRVCEANARVTGATYPSILARHFLPQGAWVLRNLRFTPAVPGRRILLLLEKEGLLYLPGRAGGVLPVNFNTLADGLTVKGQFLCLGASTDDAIHLLEDCCNLLPVEWSYDRD